MLSPFFFFSFFFGEGGGGAWSQYLETVQLTFGQDASAPGKMGRYASEKRYAKHVLYFTYQNGGIPKLDSPKCKDESFIEYKKTEIENSRAF